MVIVANDEWLMTNNKLWKKIIICHLSLVINFVPLCPNLKF